MDKIWLDHYPRDVPAEIDPDTYPSIVSLISQSVRACADRLAFSQSGTNLTFAELWGLSRDIAAYLQKERGINKGDSVGIMLPNVLAYPIVLLGSLRIGAKVVNINPWYTARELMHQLNDAGVKAMIVTADALPVLAEVIDQSEVTTLIVGDAVAPQRPPSGEPSHELRNSVTLGSCIARGQGLEFDPVELSGADIALLQYTGGTTGISKGAILTHRNIVANLMQVSATLGTEPQKGNEIIVTALPLYHIFALTINCLWCMHIGGLNLLIREPRKLPELVAKLGGWKFSVLTGVNTLFNGLLHAPGFADLDFSSLRFCIGGGAPIQRAVAERWLKVTGCHLLQGYGLSETSPLLTVNPHNSSAFDGTIGLPVPSTEISLRDEEGKEVPVGTPGELCARGPQVMRGYWGREDQTRRVFTEDGFFKTGDIATVDDKGYFRIVDRKKDMILVSGFNVFPNEIEEVIAQCHGVLESAVVAVPDERSGEAVKAFVVLQPSSSVDAEEIRNHCKHYLAAYKVPKEVEFLDALPRSSVGKILRRDLREQR